MSPVALRVPRAEAEATRGRLRELGALRDDLRIVVEDAWAYLPLRGNAAPPGVAGSTVERDLPDAGRPPVKDYREFLGGWSDRDREQAPRAYDVVGDIVLVRLPPALAGRGREIGEALLRFVPGARLVAADHGVQGVERLREVERLAGSGPWRTRHRENGVDLEVDVRAAYFSPRLAREHAHVAAEVEAGDRVYDLCCGVGPFAITIARRRSPARVVAVDVNPAAIELVRATVSRYGLNGTVEAIEASVEQFLLEAQPVERVVLNLPRKGIKYVPSVARVVTNGGTFHFYEVAERVAADGRPTALLSELGGADAWSLRERHVVHPYSPSSDLVAYTFVRSGA